MSTDENLQRAPGSGRVRRDPDPLQMTEVEKRIAEWEARHDVAARGSRAAPDVVQHYVAHERLTQGIRPRPAGSHAAAREVARPRPPAEEPPRGRGLLRRLVHRG
ncbi:hypothetical protein [Blastococcus xanthinilyticus]|uniref:Uncharacterized protein n=1 Tax=Blastococcus xanthinilyticus TaxID=1564164 RepID=A0A5S5D2V4_9ACTN|nr:hypothetical protein [Blastococcus xanthinilyticus]TYP88969.1 hypothetical protein BD833_103125 [Blastococcus xanthinilyticus]